MSSIEQIRDFWRSHKDHSLNITESAPYFHLTEVCNSCSWKNPFKRNNAKIAADLGILLKTPSAAHNNLNNIELYILKCRTGTPTSSHTFGNFPKVGDEVWDEVWDEVQAEVWTRFGMSKDKLKLN